MHYNLRRSIVPPYSLLSKSYNSLSRPICSMNWIVWRGSNTGSSSACIWHTEFWFFFPWLCTLESSSSCLLPFLTECASFILLHVKYVEVLVVVQFAMAVEKSCQDSESVLTESDEDLRLALIEAPK